MRDVLGTMTLLAVLAGGGAVALLSGPGGLLPALLPRTWRYRYRHQRGSRAGQSSGRVPARLRRVCFAADRHRCVFCGSRASLQADHVIPWIMGGPTVLWNLVTLCRACNAVKSCYWVSPQGKAYYRGKGIAPVRAAEILVRERSVRHRPLRWVRAALALAA